MSNATTLLSVIVGSKLHGLDTPESDTDYAHVVISPLIDVVSPFRDDSNQHNQGDVKDEVRYELRHFCKLAVQGNPTVLEVLWSNKVSRTTVAGAVLQSNRTAFLAKDRVYHAHRGYAISQRKRSEKTCPSDVKRMGKAAAAYLRVLMQGYQLLTLGDFKPQVEDDDGLLRRWKQGATYEETFGRYGGYFEYLEEQLDLAYAQSPLPAQAKIGWIEAFLLDEYRKR